MEMNKNLQKLILEAVEKNFQLEGILGSFYTVQQLLHESNLDTIDKLYQGIQTKINKTSISSLAVKENSKKLDILNFQASLLKEVYTFKEEKASEEANEKKMRAAKRKRNALIKDAMLENEIAELRSKSNEELAKELDEDEDY